ncbi:MAG TPA: NUDIX domain-containing protein [Nocardioidaceae bacterium]|nr:NUDIX domain-containing protein [Nocardioidaceae bacterium]
MTYTSEYPIFQVTVDIVVLTIRDDVLCALVVQRGNEPFKGRWALPGGFVEPDEGLCDAARRELVEETGVGDGVTRLEQLASYGDPGRDPRGRVVSVAWLAVVPNGVDPTAGSDAAHAEWRPVTALLGPGDLAFDHHTILGDGIERARSKLEYTALATAFVGEEFTVADLRRVYEVVWGVALDAGNFHRKVTNAGFIEPTGAMVQRGPGRPAALYRHVNGADELYPPLTRSALR